MDTAASCVTMGTETSGADAKMLIRKEVTGQSWEGQQAERQDQMLLRSRNYRAKADRGYSTAYGTLPSEGTCFFPLRTQFGKYCEFPRRKSSCEHFAQDVAWTWDVRSTKVVTPASAVSLTPLGYGRSIAPLSFCGVGWLLSCMVRISRAWGKLCQLGAGKALWGPASPP